MDEPSNGRTHEPSLRETVAELDGLRALFQAQFTSLRDILNERDKLYSERDMSRSKAVEAALVSVKEQTKASFDASEKAIVKAEDAQKAYNLSHNDLARKMDDQNKATMPRTECETRFIGIVEKIANVHDMIALAPSKVETEGRLRVLEEKITLVREDVTVFVSKGAGIEKAWGWIVAAAGSGGVLAWIMSNYAKK